MNNEDIINAIQLMKDSSDLFKALDINIRKECKAYISNKIQEFHNNNDELLELDNSIELGQFLVKRLGIGKYSLHFENEEYWSYLYNKPQSNSIHFHTVESFKMIERVIKDRLYNTIHSIFVEFNKLYNKYLL